MIPNRTFLQGCAIRNHRNLPPELEDWLLSHFEDEPYEDFFDASTLEGLVCLYCDSYANGRLDVTIPDPFTRLRERYEDLKDLVADLKCERDYLDELCNHYHEILKQHQLI
jgi:hypothetical protein